MNQKYKIINKKDYNFSHVGEASAKKYLYLLDKRKHLNFLLKGKKREKIVGEDFINQEEKDVYDELYEKDEYEEDIFDKDYKNKYKQLLEEQKQKYFDLKNSCSFLNREQNTFKDNKDKDNKRNSKKKLLDKFDNDKFKYHLIHHHHDYYLDKALLNANGAEPACTSYNPKMEYIFKKIIYSPEFKKMSGRYDHDNLKDKIEQQIEINIKQKRDKESKINQRKLEKIREIMQISKKENNINYKEKENKKPLSKRHNSVLEIRNNSMINLFKKPSQEKIIYDNNNDDLINESRNFNKKLFKRTNTMVNKGHQFMSFGINNKSNKNSFDEIKNIDEDENEEDNYNLDIKKHNISNNLDGNTLSSANHYKTTSGKKKDSSFNYNNNETDIIYPYNISKNDSNILIDNNNYSYKKERNDKNKEKRNYLKYEDNNNNSISFYENSGNKKRLTNINKNNRNISNIYSNKQNTISSLYNNKVVNFDKMLSREYVRKINERKNTIYSSLSPNYESIKPKCIMKVIYAQKPYKRYKNKEFKSIFNEFVFDINKVFNNYNNHLPPKNIFLEKMTGREIDEKSPLPSYMVNQYNRNAFNSFNDKSLEMNNYSNGHLKELKSSFNDKKSFNYKLNEQYFDNENINNEINSIMKKINKKTIYNKNNKYEKAKSLSCSNIYDNNKFNNYKKYENINLFKTKMPEYYKVNLDKLGKYPYSNGDKIDGFTLKAIKTNKSAIDLLTDYEKNIFLSKLDE